MTEVQLKISAFMDGFNKSFLDSQRKVTGFGKDVDKTCAQIDRLSNNMNKVGKDLSLKFTAPLALIGGIAVKNFLEAQKASEALDQALRASGDTTLKNKASLNAFATEMQKLSAVEDDTVTGLLAFGMNMGLTVTQSKAATKEAIAMKRAFGIDLEAGMKLSAAAMQGNYDKMAKYIPALKSCSTEAEKAALYHDTMAKAFGQAQAYAQTGMGKLENLKNSIGNLSESIGEIIFNAITPLIDAVQWLVDGFSGLSESTKTIIVVCAMLVASIGPLLIIMSKGVALYRTWIIISAAYSAGMAGTVAPTGASALALVAHKIASISATIATKGFTAALKANPIGIIVAALIALTAATVGFVMYCRNATTAAQEQAQADRDLADAKKGLGDVTNDLINKEVELQDRAYKRGGSLSQAHAQEVKQSNDILNKSELLRQAVLSGTAAQSVKAVEDFNRAVQSSDAGDNMKKQTQKMADSMHTSVKQMKEEFGAANVDMSKVAAKGLLGNAYNKQFKSIHKDLLDYGKKWKQVADETQQQILDEQQQKRKNASDEWLNEYRKVQEELKKILREHNADEQTLNEQHHQDEVDKWFINLQKKQVGYEDYLKVMKVLDEDYSKKKNDIDMQDGIKKRQEYTRNIQMVSDTVSQMSGLFSQYYSNKSAKIDIDLEKKKSALSSEYEAEKAKITASNMDAAEKAKALKQLKTRYTADVETAEAKADKQKKKIEHDAAKRNKQFQMFEAVLAIPMMVMNAYNSGMQFGPASVVMAPLLAGLAGAMGAAKLALIASTPLPAYAKGGFANTPSIFGEAGGKGEVAIPLEDSRSKVAMGILANQLLNQLRATAQVKTETSTAQSDSTQITDIYFDSELVGKARFAKLKNGEWLTPANSIVTVG